MECTRRRQREIRMRLRRRKQIRLVGIGIIALILAIVFSATVAATANAGTTESSRYKYYTSIQIEKGTNLWTIAEEYMTEEYSSPREYIKEVMNINHLVDDVIYEGAYLCIPYYSAEKK